jgi:hypothetical protein
VVSFTLEMTYGVYTCKSELSSVGRAVRQPLRNELVSEVHVLKGGWRMRGTEAPVVCCSLSHDVKTTCVAMRRYPRYVGILSRVA